MIWNTLTQLIGLSNVHNFVVSRSENHVDAWYIVE